MKVMSPTTFSAGEALAEKRLVKLSAAGVVVYADAAAADNAIGVNDYAVALNEPCCVNLGSDAGTQELTAAGVVAVGDLVFQAADGKVQVLPADAATYRNVGIALEAATGDGDIFEVMFYRFGDSTVVS